MNDLWLKVYITSIHLKLFLDIRSRINFVDLLKMANKTLSFYKLFTQKLNLYYMGYTVASFIDLKSISCTFAHAWSNIKSILQFI